MTVRELIEHLQQYDGDRLVCQSRDEEGNGIMQTWQVESGAYHEAEFGPEELTPELIEQGYSEEDVINGTPAICFWPIG